METVIKARQYADVQIALSDSLGVEDLSSTLVAGSHWNFSYISVIKSNVG